MLKWQRIYRLYGWKPFAVLAAIVLVFLLMINNQIGSLSKVSRQRQVIKSELTAKKAAIDNLPMVEQSLRRIQADYRRIEPRLVTGETPETTQLAAPLVDWLNSFGMSEVGALALPPVVTKEGILLDAQMNSKLLPQYLVRMLQQLANAPVVLSLPELEVSVTDIAAPSRLQARFRFETIYVPPGPEEQEAVLSRAKPAAATPAGASSSNSNSSSTKQDAAPSGSSRRGAAAKVR